MTSKPNLYYEKKLWAEYEWVAGLDEAGRGALAGPVCVGAVVLPRNHTQLLKQLYGVQDSKQLTAQKRSFLVPQIKASALSWAVAYASPEEIDSLGIVPATRLAATRAVEQLNMYPSFLLSDFRLELPEADIPQIAMVKGDQKSLSIASASILAKTARDAVMQSLDAQYAQYQLANHKGYGTLLHRKKIQELGYSPIHRKTFKIK